MYTSIKILFRENEAVPAAEGGGKALFYYLRMMIVFMVNSYNNCTH